jgi:dTMP kinase
MNEAKKKGLLMVFEGLDGSGKSTLANALAACLKNEGEPVSLLAFPSREGPIGALIRKVLQGEIEVAPQALAHLFAADGLHFEPTVRGLLNMGAIVIEDRHPTISGWAYQQEEHDLDTLLDIQVSHLFRPPDVVVILDVPVSVARERCAARGRAIEYYEKGGEEYLERLRTRYMAYHCLYENAVTLDGQRPLEALLNDVRAVITKLRDQ